MVVRGSHFASFFAVRTHITTAAVRVSTRASQGVSIAQGVWSSRLLASRAPQPGLAEPMSHDILDVPRKMVLKEILELHCLPRKMPTGVRVRTWLGKCPLYYFISVPNVAFKGILSHAEISSYLKLCQSKNTQFPHGPGWSQAPSVCFSLILHFLCLTGNTKRECSLVEDVPARCRAVGLDEL